MLEPERLRRWRLFRFDLVGLVGVVDSVCAPSCGGIEMISDPNFSIEISANRIRKLTSRAAASLSATSKSQSDGFSITGATKTYGRTCGTARIQDRKSYPTGHQCNEATPDCGSSCRLQERRRSQSSRSWVTPMPGSRQVVAALSNNQ